MNSFQNTHLAFAFTDCVNELEPPVVVLVELE